MRFLLILGFLSCQDRPKVDDTRIGAELPANGVTKESIVLGTVVPLSGEMEVIGRAVVEILEARASVMGSIQGRRLEVVARDSAQGSVAAAKELVQEQGVFALVAPLMSGEEEAFASWAKEEEIPVVGPFSVQPLVTRPPVREVFYVYPGSTQQVRSLVHDAMSVGAPVTLVSESGDVYRAHRQAMIGQAAKYEGDWRVLDYGRADASCEMLATKGVHRVILDGEPSSIRTWLSAAGEMGCVAEVWLPGEALEQVFLPGTIAWAGRLYASTATRPSDWTPQGLTLYQETLKQAGMDPGPLPIQLGALVSLRLFEEGLTRAGAPPTREGLVRALESLNAFETDLTRPLSFGPMRRVGALGAWITERSPTLGYALSTEGAERWVVAK